ncbi:TPA: tape measure protein [Proteus mirabilis]
MANQNSVAYKIQLDVREMLTSQRQVEQHLKSLNSHFDKTTKVVNNTEKSMFSLSKVASSLSNKLSLSMVASYSDAWVDLNNKLAQSVRVNESLAEVTDRVYNAAQGSRSSLSSTAALYSKLEEGARSYNLSAEELAQLTTIISQGFLLSGNSAQGAESAIAQFSQSLASGVLSSDSFNVMTEQGNQLLVALSKSLGVSASELRNMANEGQLTSDVLAKGLLLQGDNIGKAFEESTQTVTQSMQIAGNSLTKFLGENTTVQAGIRLFGDSVVLVSDHIETMSNILNIAAVVFGSRYVGAIALATKTKVQNMISTREATLATLQEAKAAEYTANMTVRKTKADLDAARAAVVKAESELAAARGTNAEATAQANLTATKTLATNAAIAHTEATKIQSTAINNSAIAAKAASLSIGALKNVMAFLGGPAGVAMLAASAIYYFFQKSEQAKQEVTDFVSSLDNLKGKLKELSYQEIARDIEVAKDKQALLNEEIQEQMKELSRLKTMYKNQPKELSFDRDFLNKTQANTMKEIIKLEGDLSTKKKESESIIQYLSEAQATYNQKAQEAIQLSVDSAKNLNIENSVFGKLTNIIQSATAAKSKFNAQQLKVERTKEGLDLEKQINREIQLAKAATEDKKAELQIGFDLEDRNITDGEATKLKTLYEERNAEQENEKQRKIASEAAQQAAKTAADALNNQLAQLERLNKGYKEGSLEMAQYDAVQALGSGATAPQIEKAKETVAKIFALEQKNADEQLALDLDLYTKAKALRDKELADIERVSKDDVSLTKIAARKKAEIEAEYIEKIAKIRVDNAVTPQNNLQGQIDPVQQLENEHARKLALIEAFETEKGQINQRGLELMNAANTQYEQARISAQWEIWKNQSEGHQFLADGINALGQQSTGIIKGLLDGTMTLNDAFQNVALTIVDQAISALVQMGMQQVKNMIISDATQTASNAKAVAGAAATGSSIASSMAPAAAATSVATMGSAATWGMVALAAAIPMMIAIAGGRKNGGPVNANSMYRVGEGGLPEIFRASNGNQYMIPGDNGRVLSNRQSGAGGGFGIGNMQFNFNVHAPNGITQQEATQITQMVKGTVYDVLKTELRGGALQGNPRY